MYGVEEVGAGGGACAIVEPSAHAVVAQLQLSILPRLVLLELLVCIHDLSRGEHMLQVRTRRTVKIFILARKIRERSFIARELNFNHNSQQITDDTMRGRRGHCHAAGSPAYRHRRRLA